MKKIRKAAMNHYLRNQEKSSPSELHAPRRQREHSKDSSTSRLTESDEEVEDVTPNEVALKLFHGPASSTRDLSPLISTPSYEDELNALAVQNPTPAQVNTQMLISIPESRPSWQSQKDIVEPPRSDVVLPYDEEEVVIQHLEMYLNPFVFRTRQPVGNPVDHFKTMPQIASPKITITAEELKLHCQSLFLLLPNFVTNKL